MVKGSLEITVLNVVPILTGIPDEITAQDGYPVTIDGGITDPGNDWWIVTIDDGSPSGPKTIDAEEDKTFTFEETFNKEKPEYDLILKAIDDDGGVCTRTIKVKVENAPPSVEAGGVGNASFQAKVKDLSSWKQGRIPPSRKEKN